MASSRKKVIVRTLASETYPGYLPMTGLVTTAGPDGQPAPQSPSLDLLDLSGRILALPLSSVLTVCYVREFNLGERVDPEGLTRRTFLARPRGEGLWVRLALVAGEPLDGLAPLDVSLLDGVLADLGLFLTPPDIRSNTQRVFVPRSAIESLQVLAVITNPSGRKPPVAKLAPDRPQQTLFPPT